MGPAAHLLMRRGSLSHRLFHNRQAHSKCRSLVHPRTLYVNLAAMSENYLSCDGKADPKSILLRPRAVVIRMVRSQQRFELLRRESLARVTDRHFHHAGFILHMHEYPAASRSLFNRTAN